MFTIGVFVGSYNPYSSLYCNGFGQNKCNMDS